MQDGDDEVRRSRRTRRRPDDAGPPAPPAPQGPPGAQVPPPGAHPSGPQVRPGVRPSGPQPRPATGTHPSGPQPRPVTGTHPSGPQPRPADAPPPGPVPPTGVRRVRGGPVPRRPGEPPAPQRPRDGDPGRTTPVPPAGGTARPATPGGRPARTPGTAPATARSSTPSTRIGAGTGATPAPRGGTPGTTPSTAARPTADTGATPPAAARPDTRAPRSTGAGRNTGDAVSAGVPRSGATDGDTETGAGVPPPRPARRGAADSRVTEVFDALVPRRRRRRYRDDPPAEDTTTAQEPTPEADAPGVAEPGPGETPPPARLDARARALRIGAAAAAILVLVTTAYGFAGRSEVHDGVRDVAALARDSDAILDADVQAGDRNVLVLGLQADRAGTAESARTDTAVLVHRPAGGGPAVTLSIPATLEVSRPPCRRFDAATGTYGDTVPAESRTAFATAYDVGGPACSVGVVQQLTGMPMSGVVALDLAGTPQLVDAVGGIEVCTERPVVDPVLGPVVEGSGTVELDGPTAVRFASAAGTADSSPANRVRRQQRVLAAALGDALSTASLLTPGAPGRSAAGVSSALSADGVDAGEILTLARGLARSGAAGDADTPVFLSVPVTEAPNTRGQLELRRSEARTLFSALREHEPLPESATAPASRSAAAPAPGTVVNLVDATGRPGAADRIAADLRERGYEIGTVTPGPAAPGAQVRYSPDNTDAAGTLVEALPGARPVPDPTGSRVLELVVGAGDAAPVQAVPSDDADCG
ncbi:LytR family transcriptional attenuator [Pseudonocardia alni]|uniref:LytR family transcriptional attenuator n=1 Tax=Pseudonocardia alni TaxID=33907 RepID=A0AA44UR62_PSEA5|nr:LytR family transcriptional attenuator [Pseudonocardia alni]